MIFSLKPLRLPEDSGGFLQASKTSTLSQQLLPQTPRYTRTVSSPSNLQTLETSRVFFLKVFLETSTLGQLFPLKPLGTLGQLEACIAGDGIEQLFPEQFLRIVLGQLQEVDTGGGRGQPL